MQKQLHQIKLHVLKANEQRVGAIITLTHSQLRPWRNGAPPSMLGPRGMPAEQYKTTCHVDDVSHCEHQQQYKAVTYEGLLDNSLTTSVAVEVRLEIICLLNRGKTLFGSVGLLKFRRRVHAVKYVK